MADYRYWLYDTAVFGATANAESNLFQLVTGADSTHNEQFTNMRANGALPPNEKFVIDKVSVVVDFQPAKADLDTLFNSSFIEMKIADFTVFKCITALFVDASAYGGALVQTAASDTLAVGLLGDGMEFDKPIVLPGGTPFKVRIVQGPALTANSFIKVVLSGIYTIPGSQ